MSRSTVYRTIRLSAEQRRALREQRHLARPALLGRSALDASVAGGHSAVRFGGWARLDQQIKALQQEAGARSVDVAAELASLRSLAGGGADPGVAPLLERIETRLDEHDEAERCSSLALDLVQAALADLGYSRTSTASKDGTAVVVGLAGDGRRAEVRLDEGGDGVVLTSTVTDAASATTADHRLAGETCEPTVGDQLVIQGRLSGSSLVTSRPVAVGRPTRGRGRRAFAGQQAQRKELGM